MLNIIQIRAARPKEKPYTLNDGDGLFLRVEPSGIKRWIFNRSVKGVHVSRKLGRFPELSLKDARGMAYNLYQELKAQRLGGPAKFRAVYEEWLSVKKTQIKNWRDISLRFERYILPEFGSAAIADIAPRALIDSLKADLGKRAKLETIKRICGSLRELEVFAFNAGILDRLLWQHLASVFPAPSTKMRNRPSVAYEALPEVLFKLRVLSVKAHTTWSVLLCGFYTLLRPGEYTGLRWDWIDFKSGVISIPATVMKMKRPHVVPISSQLLRLLQETPRHSEYVFPSPQGKNAHVSTNSASQFLRRNGFADILVPHGIRAIGRSWMFDNGIPFEVAELCLAHSVGTSTVQAYVRSDRLEERRGAMQRWCDFVESCTRGGADLLL